MTRARTPRPREVAAAQRSPGFRNALHVNGPGSAWRDDAECLSSDAELFFPLPAQSPDAALAVCRRCQVHAECLADALDQGELEGVRGGATAKERRAMLVSWRKRERARTA